MSEMEKRAGPEATTARRLKREYREMRDIVECEALAIGAALELALAHPERSEQLKQRCEDANNRIRSQLDGFQRALEGAFELRGV